MSELSPWQRIDLRYAVEPPLEERAEPDGRGGWSVRAERTCGGAGVIIFGWLQVADQPYAVRIGA